MWSELGVISGIVVAAVIPVALFIIDYLLKYDKHLYCITMQSIDISDIKDKTLSESIGIFLSWNDMKKKIKNLYTTKVKIANAGFSQIKNEDPNKKPLTLRFDEESEIIAIKKEKNLGDRGILIEAPDEEKNAIKIKYGGLSRKKSIYLEVTCINGKAKLPDFNAHEPLKTTYGKEGYEPIKAKEEKKDLKVLFTLSIISLSFFMSLFILFALSDLLNAFSWVLFIFLFLFSALIIRSSLLGMREIDLLTISSPNETELETKLFIERSIR